MRFALVNPAWTFEGSTYFGCQEPHYPLELLFAYDKVHEAGHNALLIDAQLERVRRRGGIKSPIHPSRPVCDRRLWRRAPTLSPTGARRLTLRTPWGSFLPPAGQRGL